MLLLDSNVSHTLHTSTHLYAEVLRILRDFRRKF